MVACSQKNKKKSKGASGSGTHGANEGGSQPPNQPLTQGSVFNDGVLSQQRSSQAGSAITEGGNEGETGALRTRKRTRASLAAVGTQ